MKMTYCTRLLRTIQLEVFLLKRIGTSSIKILSNGEPSGVIEIPNPKEILSETTKKNCMKRFKAIKISPRSKPSEDSKNAAVLIPLCMVNNQLSLLYTLRKADLKRHRGQVSFPGGIQDPSDKSLEETALRETEEELGINRLSVDLWGSGSLVIGLEFSVLPVLGYLGEVDLEKLTPNPDEVETVFAISLKHFCDPHNCRYTQFRVGSERGYVLPSYLNAKFRVWGITALITHIVLTSLLPNHYKHRLEYVKPIVLTQPVL